MKKTVDEIFESLKDFNFFDNRGHILRLSESIWKDAENRLYGELSMKYLYLSQNRNGILERFREKYNIVEGIFSKLTSLINESNESNYSNWSMSSPCVLKPWRTVIYLDKKTWQNKILEYGTDNKCSMLPRWTNVIYNEIWKQLKIPCCYSFKSGKVNPEEIFLKIKGKCPECSALFNAYSMHESDDETDMKIHISTYDTTDIIHKKSSNYESLKEVT